MNAKALGALVLLAGVWGGSFLFMRVAAPVLGPVPLVFVRVALAALALFAYAAAARKNVAVRPLLRRFLVMGLLNAAVPFTLISFAELRLSAGLAAILNATTPLFAALVAAVWLRDRFTTRQAIGLLLGLVGVGILVGWDGLPTEAILWASVGASLFAAVSYALAGVFAKRAFAGVPPLTLAIGQQTGASLLLLPVAVPTAIITAPSIRLTTTVIVAVLALALLCTSVAYLLYFYLIAAVGPTRTLSVTFLIPVFGLLWGVLFLGEAISTTTVFGLGVVLASVFLVTATSPTKTTVAAPVATVRAAGDGYEI